LRGRPARNRRSAGHAPAATSKPPGHFFQRQS
jgi:hypothetical protein